jgi:plasmid stabilization system protein ParE
MKLHRVVMTETALAEADTIYAWVSRHAPETAIEWFNDLQERVLSLDTLPGRCAAAPERDAIPGDIRHLIVGDYRVIFELKENT